MTKETDKKTAKPKKASKAPRAKDAAPKMPAAAPESVPDTAQVAPAAEKPPAPPEGVAVADVQQTLGATAAAPAAAPQPAQDPPQPPPQASPQAAPQAPVTPEPGPYPDPTMTAAPPQHQVPQVEPDTSAQTNVVNQAMDVIAASDSQQNSIRRAFELQRATIAHGVKERRAAATEEMAATKAAYEQQKGNYPMNQQQGQMGYGAAPQGQPGMPGQPGMQGQQLSTNQILAQEFAETIRGMIAQEVDRQLKTLLSAYTASQNDQPQEQATQQPQQQAQPQPQGPAA